MGITFELEDSGFKGFIPDGEICPARVLSVESKKQRFTDKETGEDVYKVEFKFEITDGPYEGVQLWGKTGTKYNNHPYCKLYIWSQAILGFELPIDFRLDTDDLLDKDCRIVVHLDQYKDKTTGVEKERNEVTDVMPSRSNMENFSAASLGAPASQDEEPF